MTPRSSPPLSCRTSPLPARPSTVTPTGKVVFGGELLPLPQPAATTAAQAYDCRPPRRPFAGMHGDCPRESACSLLGVVPLPFRAAPIND